MGQLLIYVYTFLINNDHQSMCSNIKLIVMDSFVFRYIPKLSNVKGDILLVEMVKQTTENQFQVTYWLYQTN